MRVLVLSDTHLTDPAKLPPNLMAEIQLADYILHAGDFTSLKVVQALEQAAPFQGVAGNNDGLEIVNKLGFQAQFELAGFQIGMVHGDSGGGQTTLQRAMYSFADCKLDLLVFGHSHMPYLQKHGDTWVMNPGSPTNRRKSPSYTYGLIELDNEIRAELVYF